MAISEVEFEKEKKILKKTNNLLQKNINQLAKDVSAAEEDLVVFKKMMWSDSHSFDAGEVQQVMAATELEAEKFFQKQDELMPQLA